MRYPIPTYIYHITDIANLSSIIDRKGLWAFSKHQPGLNYRNIAHQSIQDRRKSTLVPVRPFGTIHDYVPFYFAPRSPMLYTIHKGNVAGYFDGQDKIVYLVSSVQRVVREKSNFVFTDGHAIMDFTSFYFSVDDLDKIDWNIMEGRYWADTEEDMDRKRRRQAEFLVRDFFPWSYVEKIGVINLEMKKEVVAIIRNADIQPIVEIQDNWYY